MNLAELQTEVYTITGRPDRVAETLSAIKIATLKAHHGDFYSKDLYETGIVFADSAYIQQLDTLTLFPRFRKLKYLRKFDIASNEAGAFLEIILPEQVLDGWGVTRDDVAYEGGAVLNIRSSTSDKYFILGMYLHPDITADGYSSWIATAYPFAIVFAAAALVLRAIGKEEDAGVYERYAQDQYIMLRSSELALTGF